MNSSEVLAGIEIYAFVGPAGTGKSHRATHVAKQHGIDYIIDDGAKSEINRLRAIKRAIFEYPEHRDEVVNYLIKHTPKKLMILATSTGMIDKITARLGLNSPVRTIEITEISTQEEINAALRERREKKTACSPRSQSSNSA